jgi:hypothetical protein
MAELVNLRCLCVSGIAELSFPGECEKPVGNDNRI